MTEDILFKSGKFVAHSGDTLDFKIECDALSDESIVTIAEYIASRTDFGMVQGIPRGGCRLADALEPYADWQAPFNVLIVNDVFTTGKSMEQAKAKYVAPWTHPDDVIGWVIFARTEPPPWINAVFRMV